MGLRKEWYYEVVVADVTVAGVKLDVDCKEVTCSFSKQIKLSNNINATTPFLIYKATIIGNKSK